MLLDQICESHAHPFEWMPSSRHLGGDVFTKEHRLELVIAPHVEVVLQDSGDILLIHLGGAGLEEVSHGAPSADVRERFQVI